MCSSPPAKFAAPCAQRNCSISTRKRNPTRAAPRPSGARARNPRSARTASSSASTNAAPPAPAAKPPSAIAFRGAPCSFCERGAFPLECSGLPAACWPWRAGICPARATRASRPRFAFVGVPLVFTLRARRAASARLCVAASFALPL